MGPCKLANVMASLELPAWGSIRTDWGLRGVLSVASTFCKATSCARLCRCSGAEALEALDGDYLEQVLDLAATELSELVHDAAHVQPAEAHSLDEVITLLQGVL